MKRGTEKQVVDLGELVVDGLDEIVFDGGHGERACGGVSSHILLLVFSIK